MDAKQEIMLGMIRRFVEIGVEFAYPTQTTFTAAPDGTMIMPYSSPSPIREASGKTSQDPGRSGQLPGKPA